MFLRVIVLFCALSATNAKYGFKVSDITRIVGGSKAVEGQFPYQVSLQLGIGPLSQHFCGGSIMTERLIITAAHCVLPILDYGLKDFTFVRAGLINLKNPFAGQTVQVAELLHHSEFTVAEPGPYDIGVVVLKTTLKFSENVVPVVLPKPEAIPEGNAFLSGWGAINPEGDSLPSDLQFAELPLISYQICKEVYDSYPEDSPLDETNLCTGPITGGQSACSGDSGGPLAQMNDAGEYELLGIVSWGVIPCGSENAPTVYTRVSAYIDYLSEVKEMYDIY